MDKEITFVDMDDRMFDFASFYDRMANELPNNCMIAEVGVANGASALYLANKLHSLGKKFKLFMIDNLDYGKTKQLDTLIKNIMASGLSEYIALTPLDSLNASCLFNDGFLDMVFLDSSHEYSATKAEILLWSRKVKDGCVLAGHDYMSHEGVMRAVDEMVPFMITRDPLPDGQTFESKKLLNSEDTRDHNGVWWFRKQWYVTIK